MRIVTWKYLIKIDVTSHFQRAKNLPVYPRVHIHGYVDLSQCINRFFCHY